MSINLTLPEMQKISAAYRRYTEGDPDEDGLRTLIEDLQKLEGEMRERVRREYDGEPQQAQPE